MSVQPKKREITKSVLPTGAATESTVNAVKAKTDNLDTLLSNVPNRKGTPTSFNVTASGTIVAAPGAGKKLHLYGFTLLVLGDEQVRLRWNNESGSIIAGLPTKGTMAMNLLGINESGGENQALYLEKTGSGGAQGRVWTEAVNV